MPQLRNHTRSLFIGTCCAAAGVAGGAIATAGAATHGTPAHGTKGAPAAAVARTAKAGRLRRLAARAVHGDVVVHTRRGFVTVTFDRGTVQTVSGRQLTIAEGTPKATYRTVTLTIPADARVRDNGHLATLAQVTQGQRVAVVTAPKRTFVIAHTPKHS